MARRKQSAVEAPRTRFVGRAEELAEVDRQLRRARLVTILGPPGAGKTRLAREAAGRSAARFAGGVIHCDLTPARTRADADTLVARALGASVPDTDSLDTLETAIAAALAARRPTLVVLDNFEHLVEQEGEALDRWIAGAPAAVFLVTSREALHLEGEEVVTIVGLPEADAVALFVDRARSVDPRFRAGGNAHADVVEIVRRLDGLPLAIELASSRMGVMTAAELRERLPAQIAALRPRHRNAPARHSSLRAAVEASWSLLSPADRDALAQCIVFAAPFALADAEAVLDLASAPRRARAADRALRATVTAPAAAPRRAGRTAAVRPPKRATTDRPAPAPVLPDPTPPNVALALESLCDRCLLAREPDARGGWRFRVLSSIRDVLADGLAAASDDARLRHAEHVRDRARTLADGIGGPTAADCLRSLAELLPELLAAHRFALDHDPGPIDRRGPRPLRGHPGLAIDLALALDRALHVEGPFPLRFRILESTATPAVLDRVDPEHAAELLLARGVARLDMGRHADAAHDLDAAAAIGRREGKPSIVVRAGFQLGNCALFVGRYDEARAHYEAVLPDARALGDHLLTAKLLNNTAMVLAGVGEIDEARRLYEESIVTGRRVSARFGGPVLVNLGQLDHQQGRLGRARTLFLDAETELSLAGDRYYGCFGLVCRAWLEIEDGDRATAAAVTERARALLADVRDARLEGLVLTTEGVLLALRDRPKDAHARFLEARAPLEAAGDRGCLDALDALEGFVDLAHGRAASAARRAQHVERARERLARLQQRADAGEVMISETRVPMRLLARATEELMARASSDSRRLEVGPTGAWFRLGNAALVDLSHRRAVRRLFAALADRRLAAPGRPLTTAQVLAAGWPGEKMQRDSARKRLYVAVHTLRALGLADHLQNRGEGYLLDPDLPIVRAQSAT